MLGWSLEHPEGANSERRGNRDPKFSMTLRRYLCCLSNPVQGEPGFVAACACVVEPSAMRVVLEAEARAGEVATLNRRGERVSAARRARDYHGLVLVLLAQGSHVVAPG